MATGSAPARPASPPVEREPMSDRPPHPRTERRKAPTPLCKSFLVCRQIVQGPVVPDFSLIGLTRHLSADTFPAAQPLGIFARLTSGHGAYRVEVQLQDMEGEVVWQDGPPDAWAMEDPLQAYDLLLKNMSLFCPRPGAYDVVLLVDGTEIARDKFFAHQTAPAD